jgi:hypothetical protein
MLEAIAPCESITGRKMNWSYREQSRVGDHVWWISDVRRFQRHYPGWRFRFGLRDTLVQIHDELARRARVPDRQAAAHRSIVRSEGSAERRCRGRNRLPLHQAPNTVHRPLPSPSCRPS